MRIVDFIRNGRISINKDRIPIFLVNDESFSIYIERGSIDSIFLEAFDNKETSYFVIDDCNSFPFIVGMNLSRLVIYDSMTNKWKGYDIKDILVEEDSYLALKYDKNLFGSIFK